MTMTESQTTNPRAWVGCLACYNDGRLTGEWVDGLEAGDFTPCTRPGHEEWWCFDHEGYDGLIAGECGPMEAQAKAELVDKLEDEHIPVGAFAAYCSNIGESASVDQLEGFEDEFRGEWDSVEDYARELFEDTAGSREEREMADRWPFTCIDWEHAARELVIGGDIWTETTPDYRVWVFNNI